MTIGELREFLDRYSDDLLINMTIEINGEQYSGVLNDVAVNMYYDGIEDSGRPRSVELLHMED